MTSYTDIFSKKDRVEDMELYSGAGDVNEQLARYGVKFGIYKNNEFKEQLFPFDMIPRVIDRKEFAFLYVTKPRTLARLSCHFYREGNHKEGAFWLRRLENLSGRNRAYFVAAREFIKYKETRAIAAELLGEATKLGNPNSTEMLEQYIQPNNVFTEYQKKHEMATDEK